MAYHRIGESSGLNISNVDPRYQQNWSTFEGMSSQPAFASRVPQHHQPQKLRRPKSTSELSTISNIAPYGAYQPVGGDGNLFHAGPTYPTPANRQYEPERQDISAYQQQDTRYLPLGAQGIHPPFSPYRDNAQRYPQPSTPSRNRQPPDQPSNPQSGRYSQQTPIQWRTSGYPGSPDNGRTIGPGIAVPGSRSQPGTPYIPFVENDSMRTNGSGVFPPRLGGPRKRALSEGEVQLNRQGTLLTPHATDKRASAELGIMLGSGRLKIQKGKLLPQGELPIEEKLAKLDQVKLEAKKGRKARVEVDVILESDVMVEGGQLRGRLEVRIRKSRKGESLWIGAGKVRVCGYEEHAQTDTRHIFYHYPHQLPLFSRYDDSQHPLFASPTNEEGYRLAREGFHVIPFSVRLPLNGGAKGGWVGSRTTGVKYVVVGSIKLHTPETKKRSIAHFYRPCTIYPYVPPLDIFGSTEHPTEVRTEQGLGWSLSGEKGKVRVIAELPRPDWVAGQNVWIKIFADNQSQKKIRTLNIALLEQIVLFKPPPSKKGQESNPPDLKRYSAVPIRKKICDETIEASPGHGPGYVGSPGWWTGVQPGERSRWQGSLMLPSHLLSIRRSQLIEITYIIRLTLNNTITLDVPLNIINFLSIDPPPSVNVTIPVARMTATDSRRIEMEVDSSVRANEDFGGKQGRYSGNSEDNKMEVLISERSSSRTSKAKSQIFYPKDRQRPESIYQEDIQEHRRRSPLLMPEPHVPFNRPRPLSTSSLPSGSATPQFRPGLSKRDTTASYYSAVASLAEDEDLGVVETRRRHGRQMSLAALTGDKGDHSGRSSSLAAKEEEDGDNSGATRGSTPLAGTYAPSVTLETPEDSGFQELEEAERDLEFVQHASVDHESAYDRDSASRYLESELVGETNYQRRFNDSQSDDSHGSCMDCHERLSHRSESVHTCDSASTMEGERHGEHDTSALDMEPADLSIEVLSDPSVEDPFARPRMASLYAAREQHMLGNRSVFGSVAASVMSGVSGTETEIGKVVQAIRRDLSIRQPAMAEYESHKLPLRQARSPEPSSIEGQPGMQVGSNSLALPLLLLPQASGHRPSAPAAAHRKNSYISSPNNNSTTRGNSIAIDAIAEDVDQQSDESHSSREEINAAPGTSSISVTQLEEVNQMLAESSTPKSKKIPEPVEDSSVSPGLAPSIGEDSASSHQESRATTPANDLGDEQDLYVMDNNQDPLSPTEHALEQLMIDADETMASLGLDTISRKNLAAKCSLASSRESDSGSRLREREGIQRSPAGPRHRNSVASSAPDSPLSQYSESLGHGHDVCRSPEIQRTPSNEQTTPTRRSHTAILGAARNRISNRTSGTSHTTDYLTHSPGSSINSQHMIMTPGRHHAREFDGQYHLEDIPEVRSMASDPSLRKREADRSSINSASSVATMEKMQLERKTSAHIFPYSKQMSGYTIEQLRPMNGMSVSVESQCGVDEMYQ
ncbi:hypothetical protein QFC22_000534 [Naganishia vaughanmartiniae]|uniref:Uncharacterized protein n=1 Tax=Naganishia vaughanmartiniae TaxID=1424756 RepID=A0ACC2XNL9_9TREE|nr:hypothetical protein QFC22_000534 [Naganishia vaughanmartiniae]